MFRGVIFDMDGVLVDNSKVHVDAFVEWCRIHNVDFAPGQIRGLFGMGNDDIFKEILTDPTLSDETIRCYADEKEEIYRKLFASTITPVPGLVDLLKGLKEKGIKIAVGSSGMRANVEFVLDKCGISQYFDAIADGDMITRAKPDPEVFLLAAKLLGLAPSDCLVLEDSFAGVEAARRAGMKVVVLATTYSQSEHKDYDLIIDDFTQVDVQSLLNLKTK